MRCRLALTSLIALLAVLCPAQPSTQGAAPASRPSLERNPSIIAFGSCLRQDRDQTRIWQSVLAQNPELFIFLGDNVYGDTFDMDVMRAKYAQLASQPGFQALRDRVVTLATWDDHDYGLNNAGHYYRMRDGSQTVFRTFWGQGNYGDEKGVYSAHRFGETLVVLLDTRYYRDWETRPDGPNKTLLGAPQWEWLEKTLKDNSDARLVLIGSSVQFVAEEHDYEKWGWVFEHDRQKLLAMLKDLKVDGVLFLTGDRHHAEISRKDFGLGFPIYDITSSSMAAEGAKWREEPTDDEPNASRLSKGVYKGNNFGIVAIDWNQPDPPITLRIHDETGTLIFEQGLTLGEISLQQEPPAAN